MVSQSSVLFSVLSLLMTRPQAQAERFVQHAALPLPVIYAPLMGIRARDGLTIGPDVSALILTSENAVVAQQKALPHGLTAYCVGPKTAQTAREAGLNAQILGPDADALVAALIALRPKGALLHLRGAVARGEIVQRLREAGLSCDDAVAYDQPLLSFRPDLKRSLEAGARCLVPLFSPRTAAQFRREVPHAPGCDIVCLSQAVAAPLVSGSYGEIVLCDSPDGEAMVRALRARLFP